MPETKCVSIKIGEKVPASAPETFAMSQHLISDGEHHGSIAGINKSKLVKLASAGSSSAEIGQIAVTIAEPLAGRTGVIKRPRAIIPKPKRTDDSTQINDNQHEENIHQHMQVSKQNSREDSQGCYSTFLISLELAF